MAGESELKKLLQNMNPELNDGVYVFCTLEEINDSLIPEAIGWFREREGMTVVLPKDKADELGFTYSFISAWITLNVHSSLEAVGLTAAVSKALTDAGISCNVIAAYYHDHLYVPLHEAERAMDVLRKITK